MNVVRVIAFTFGGVIGAAGIFCLIFAIWLIGLVAAWPHDVEGRFASSPLKTWFDTLASQKGLCCSFADGEQLNDVDWDTKLDIGTQADAAGTAKVRYRVLIDGKWIIVPDAAVVNEPNRFGPAVVWPYKDAVGNTQIRCFLPGAGA